MWLVRHVKLHAKAHLALLTVSSLTQLICFSGFPVDTEHPNYSQD